MSGKRFEFTWNPEEMEGFVSSKMRQDRIRVNLAKALKNSRRILENY